MGRFEYLEGEVPDIPCAAAVKTSTHVYVSGTAVFQDEQGNVFSDVKDQTLSLIHIYDITQFMKKRDIVMNITETVKYKDCIVIFNR